VLLWLFGFYEALEHGGDFFGFGDDGSGDGWCQDSDFFGDVNLGSEFSG
jgi:hypothetical protein